MVILDTNIIIDHLRQTGADSLLMQFIRHHSKETLAISTITVQELYEGQSTKNELAERNLLVTIGPLKVLPYTYEIAQLAGKIARDFPRRNIEFADAAIAATTITHHGFLCTLNAKDFAKIPELALFDKR